MRQQEPTECDGKDVGRIDDGVDVVCENIRHAGRLEKNDAKAEHGISAPIL